MAKKRKAPADAPVTPVSAGMSHRDQIDAALNRLLCDVALADHPVDGGIAHAATAVVELVALVRGLASPALEPRIAAIAAASGAGQLEQALGAFSAAWAAWTVHGDTMPEPVTPVAVDRPADPPPAPAAPAPVANASAVQSRVDEDLAALQGDPELAAMFIGEALDHLGTIEASVLQLEASPDDSKLLNDIFRPFHTVKGNAGALGVTRVQELAHKVENLLDLCRSGRHAFGPAETDAALEAVDVLSALVTDLQARLNGQPGTDLEPKRLALMDVVQRLVDGTGASTAPPVERPAAPALQEAPSAADPAPKPNQTKHTDDGTAQASVKVDTRKLDNLVDMVGELVIAQAILQEDPSLLKAADERLTRNLAQLKRITSDLQKNAMSMRMVPIRQTFQKMARLVRDLSKKSGKLVDLVLSGEDTELDRRVVEDINDPLMHMVRNSMDHGLEDTARRTQAGKRPEGRLALSAYHQGGNIVIAIEDDGAGLNTERILAKAMSQGLVQPDETLSPAEIHQMIFKPGFSTAEKVTEISGRGVGMDVVRRNIDALRGRIEIQSTLGQGTTFLIKLPLTLAILDGLLLGVGSERFVMPTFAVRESLRPMPEQVHTVKGHPCMIQVRDKLVPLVRLADLYGIDAQEADICRSTVVVIEDDGHQVGLVVDRLLGKQEVVIKSLGETFGQMAGVAGGAILGDGRVGLILDAHGIVGRTRSDGARAA
jgi:two-component system chemotaxis sensor kinase CheA